MTRLLCVFGLMLVAQGSIDAQAIDTVSILRATVLQMRAEGLRQDSAHRVRCVDASMPSCPPPYPHAPVWYLETHGLDGIRAAELLAKLDSVEYVPHSAITPRCPWPANAEPPAGYRLRVSFELLNPDTAEVGVHFKCGNPHGYHHPVYLLTREYLVVRQAGGWKAGFARIRVT